MVSFTQLAIAVITIIFLGLSFRFDNIKEKEKQKETDNQDLEKIKKFHNLELIFFGMTVIGAGYFLYYLITTTPFTFGNTVLACIKATIFLLILLEMLYFKIKQADDIEVQISTIVVVAVTTTIIVSFASWINYDVQESKFQKNIVAEETEIFTKNEYGLLKEFDTSGSEENNITQSSVSEYFDYSFYNSNGWEDKTYEIYYKTEEKQEQMVHKYLDAEDVKLTAIKEEEKPYLEEKIYTIYGTNNNVEPPERCIVQQKTEYVLHVPQKDIDKVLKMEKEYEENN